MVYSSFRTVLSGRFTDFWTGRGRLCQTDRRWSAWRIRHLVSGVYRPGQFGWILERPIRFKSPISSFGRLNLFNPAATLQTSLEEAESIAASDCSSQTRVP
jgi:hypothetical protein